MSQGAPLKEQLSSGRYREMDEQLLRITARQLELKDPYIVNGGI